jgi:hypothetical protein
MAERAERAEPKQREEESERAERAETKQREEKAERAERAETKQRDEAGPLSARLPSFEERPSAGGAKGFEGTPSGAKEFPKPWAVYVDSAGNRYVTDEHSRIMGSRQKAGDFAGALCPSLETFRFVEPQGATCRVEVAVPSSVDLFRFERGDGTDKRLGSLPLSRLPRRALVGVEISAEEAAPFSRLTVALFHRNGQHVSLKGKVTAEGDRIVFLLDTPYEYDEKVATRAGLRIRASPRSPDADTPAINVKVLQEDVLCECWVEGTPSGAKEACGKAPSGAKEACGKAPSGAKEFEA